MGKILSKINTGTPVRELSQEELEPLCGEIRSFLIEHVSKTGGHLASNLGLVELTVALHRVFDTSRDRLVFDVGHQCYPHKLLTGRMDQFSALRQYGGLSGFPKPEESVHDAFVAGHASTSVSAALGMARARTQLKEDYSVIAVVGDGALTGGLVYEALNDAGQSGEPLLVILNDNGMSIDKNVGGVGRYFSHLRLKPRYHRMKSRYHRVILRIPGGKTLYRFFHRIKTAVKNALLPGSMFENMGFTYLGPTDGHNLKELCDLLEMGRQLRRPVLLHIRTVKGKGYLPAQEHPERFHGVSPFDPATGMPLCPGKETFSHVFGETLRELAREDSRICAVTPAMAHGTGLVDFQQEFPDRYFDVGIAEEHAVTMAAGMAKQGLRPVCAIYSTFLQRAYDMLAHDVCLQRLPVLFAVDRAGIVGEDGPTHNGVFDVGFLCQMPHMTVYSPASFAELRHALRLAMETDGPVAVRYPRGGEKGFSDDTMDRATAVIRPGTDITLMCYGRMTGPCLAAAELLADRGIQAEVVKINRLKPLDLEPVRLSAAKTGRLFSAEEGLPVGSIGQQTAAALVQMGAAPAKLRLLYPSDGYLPHGDLDSLLRDCRMDPEGIAGLVEEECRK